MEAVGCRLWLLLARGRQMNDAILHMFPLRARGTTPPPLCRSNVNVPMEV